MIPGFDTPFQRSELVGFFVWNESLTESLIKRFPRVYHACHDKQFRMYHRRNKLFLRSNFEVLDRKGGGESYECVWTSLQPWHVTHGHNHFGPITVEIPLKVLDGRRFYVFERELRGWRHYYLVQRESTSPLFGAKYKAKRIEPSSLFRKTGMCGQLTECANTQYEVVLTDMVPLGDCGFVATDHRRCALGVCKGMNKSEARQVLRATMQKELAKIARRFPQLKLEIYSASE